MLEITEEDIEKVERKFNLNFDDKSKEFIKCLESKDIQACPGAGKTTSLVAKLDILSNHMPFRDNSGILVLTHTNVAVDEIKKKLGVNAKKVLNYPNHVGTFQSFVNKYLATPMYIKLVGNKPERIDSEVFEILFYNKLSNSVKYGLKEKFKQNETTDFGKENNVKSFIKKFYIDDNNNLQNFNGEKFAYNHNPPSNTYKELRTIKSKLFNEGFLTFDDTYYLATKYLECYSQIINIFQKRFKYVFIDEAQDTDDKQFKIIKKLFTNSNVIIQRIGDNNQAIFNFSGQKEQGWQIKEDHIEIKDTKRLSKHIASLASNVALNPQELNGSEDIDIQPTIILFDDGKIEKVIPAFAELIIEHNLHTQENAIFKAIGGVGKTNDKGHTIPSYYSNYIKNDNGTVEYDNLIEKLQDIDNVSISLKDYRDMILDIIREYLKRVKVKNGDNYFTKYTLLNFLKESDEKSYDRFKLLLLKITTKLNLKECVRDDIEFLIIIYLDLVQKAINVKLLDAVIKDYKIEFSKQVNNNFYTYEIDDTNFNIEISTIHRVKGETHTATMVFETFNRGYDLFQLLTLLKGKKKAKLEDKKKLAYVAMSRATHFLCFAIHKQQKNSKEISEKDIEELESNGIKVIQL